MARSNTAQAIYDRIVTHLGKQKRRALDEDGLACVYRGPNGIMCAVGCELTDEEYKPSMEGHSVDGIDLPKRLAPHKGMLADLQNAHDDGATNEDGTFKKGHGLTTVARRLIAVAETHKLNTQALVAAFPHAKRFIKSA